MPFIPPPTQLQDVLARYMAAPAQLTEPLKEVLGGAACVKTQSGRFVRPAEVGVAVLGEMTDLG